MVVKDMDPELEKYRRLLKDDALLSDADLKRLSIIFPAGDLQLLGVYRVNKIPQRLLSRSTNGYIILNLDREGGGTHWTVMILHGGDVFYNDSYGMPPPDDLMNRLEYLYDNQESNMYWSTVQRQPINSNRCGWHCLVFVMEMGWSDDDLRTTYELLDKRWLQTQRGDGEERAKAIEKQMVDHILKYFKLLDELE